MKHFAFFPVLVLLSTSAFAQGSFDWPQWQGPDRNAISRERGLLQEWPEKGPALTWKANGIGEGMGGIAVSNGRIYTTGDVDGTAWIYALKETNGDLICTPGAADGTLMALDKMTGKKIWKSPVPVPAKDIHGRFSSGPGYDSGARYASAIAIDFEGVRQYVQLTAKTLAGFSASDGKLLWQYDPVAAHISCSTPIYQDGLVFASSAYEGGGGAVRLSMDSDGKVMATEVYFTTHMRNHHGGMIVVDGALYGAAGGNEGGFLVCMDFKTGEVLWRERQAPKGSLAMADGRLYLRAESGTMILIEPNREKYVERGRFDQPNSTREPAWTHPVIANGKLYIRDQDTLFCYDVKKK